MVRQMLDAFNRGDIPAVIAAFDESCELYEPPEMPDTPTPGFRGHDGIREWMTNLREVAGSSGSSPASFTTSGDVLLSELAARGLGQASGVPIEWTPPSPCSTSMTARSSDRRPSWGGPKPSRAAGLSGEVGPCRIRS